jgi:hypothetical protein
LTFSKGGVKYLIGRCDVRAIVAHWGVVKAQQGTPTATVRPHTSRGKGGSTSTTWEEQIMRKSKIVALAVLIGVLTIIGVAYAIDYTGGYFRATGSNPDNYSYTEMSLNKIHFTG